MKSLATFIALNRFGLGPAPGEADQIAADPRGWLRSQVRPRQAIPSALAAFPSSADTMAQIHTARLAGGDTRRQTMRGLYRNVFQPEVLARSRSMIAAKIPFAERMVLFWSNHFTVSRSRGIIGPAIPAYEREAIRPHVFGRFEDMLTAVCGHNCMLTYLDNALSIGPNSFVGVRRRRRTGGKKTINENLAREILELHTLGVNGGYSQKDIVAFAKVLTGWSHGGLRPRRPPNPGRGRGRGRRQRLAAAFREHRSSPVHGSFEFNPFFHEPGSKTVLGKTYREDGVNEGLAVLHDLARHPSTAKFIATKLARHFVADDPPAAAVNRIASVFRKTDGDLAAVSLALIDLEEAWANPLAKVKSHYELVISVLRATGSVNARRRDIIQPLRELGQLPFNAPSPQGWGDVAKSWVAPEALMRRVEWLRRVSSTAGSNMYPAILLENSIGPVATQATRTWVERAPSGDAAIALIFASPEFQRR